MRMNIYIPDALAERLEQHKENINVSAVCRAAIEREIEAVEASSVAEKQIIEDGYGNKRSFMGTHVGGTRYYDYYVTEDRRLVAHDGPNIIVESDVDDIEKTIAGLVESGEDELAGQLTSALGLDIEIPL